MAPLGQILHSLDINDHFYADDLKIYLTQIIGGQIAETFGACLTVVNNWLIAIFCVCLNPVKKEQIIIGP